MIFALNLLPPRPDFAQTMTAEEQAAMGEHVGYWQGCSPTGWQWCSDRSRTPPAATASG